MAQIKKNKLKLEEIQLTSFITSLNENEKSTLEGGTGPGFTPAIRNATIPGVDKCPVITQNGGASCNCPPFTDRLNTLICCLTRDIIRSILNPNPDCSAKHRGSCQGTIN